MAQALKFETATDANEKSPSPHEDSASIDTTVPQASGQETPLTLSDKSWRAILITCIPIVLICLLIRLDETILATTIPRISDQFDSFDQIRWYGPSYLFGLCASQLPFGRAYKDYPSRLTYLLSLFLFEVASIMQAAAPSSEVSIAGRVFAGIGGAGVLTGSLTLFFEETPKAFRDGRL